MRMRLALKLLAPYIAVVLFWCIVHSGWLAIVVYHAQILAWSRQHIRKALQGRNWAAVLWAAPPSALVGPLLYVLLPRVSATDPRAWLATYGLTGPALALMIPYFGLLHPILEEAHWFELRDTTPVAHAAFAGYHGLVLYTLLTPAWLALCLVALLLGSIAWQRAVRRFGGLFVPCCTHVLTDCGIVLAAWFRR